MNRIRLGLAGVGVLVSSVGLADTFTPVDFSVHHNYVLQDHVAGAPIGDVILGGSRSAFPPVETTSGMAGMRVVTGRTYVRSNSRLACTASVRCIP